MTTLWDTTGTAVVKALAAERRTGGAVLSGLALTLVVVVDEKDVARGGGGGDHRRVPAPVPAADRDPPPDRGAGAPAGRRGAGRRPARPGEAIVMRMYGRLALHAESVTLPLLAPDAPVVTWWHGPPPELSRTTRSASSPTGGSPTWPVPGPGAALRQRAEDYRPGDTDLAWTRTTPWRAELASAFDTVPAPRRPRPGDRPRDDPATPLLAGWLSPGSGCRCRSSRPAGGRPGSAASGCPRSAVDLDERRLGPAGPQGLQHGGCWSGPGSRPARWRCPSASSATCSPRSCAGSTPTSRTRRRSGWPPASTGWSDRPAEPRTHDLAATRCCRTRCGGTPGRRGPGAAAATSSRHRWRRTGAGEPSRPPATSRRRRSAADPGGASGRRLAGADCAAGRRCRPARGRVPVSGPEVVVHATADLLAEAVAARLVTRLVDAQAARGSASVVLTGGGVGTAVLRALRDSPARDAVDWAPGGLWWGDERWVPAGDPERNDTAGPGGAARRACRWTRPGCTPSRPRTATTPATRRRPPPAYAAELAGRGRRRAGAALRRAACSASARRGTSRRSSPSRRPRTTSGRWPPCTAAPSRRRPGSPDLPGDPRGDRGLAGGRRRGQGGRARARPRRRRPGAGPGLRRPRPRPHALAPRPRRRPPSSASRHRVVTQPGRPGRPGGLSVGRGRPGGLSVGRGRLRAAGRRAEGRPGSARRAVSRAVS